MLEQLKKYIRETSSDELRQEWEKVEQLGFTGPNAFEYIEFLNDNYKLFLPRFCEPKGVKIPENMTPNFSGSFFLLNIAS
jgi:hypothetical protein